MDRLRQEDLRPPPAAPGMRIGLLGGSFNPPHAAHHLITIAALKRLALNQVWWLVTPGNPLKDPAILAPLATRLRLCRELAHDVKIKVTALEAKLGTAHTASTLRYLVSRFPHVRFVWLMGADNLASFHRWNDWTSIFETMPVAVADRPRWRYRALASPAAHRFGRVRSSESDAAMLPRLAAPAWCYLSGPVSDLSSTGLRFKNGDADKQLLHPVSRQFQLLP